MRRVLAAVLFCVPLAAASASACQVYGEDLLVPEVPFGGGIGFWSGRGDQGCYSAGVPREAERPNDNDASELPPFYLVLRTIRLGERDINGIPDPEAWKDLGFDLDGVCTNSATCQTGVVKPSCKPVGATVPYDGNHCRDNTFGRLAYEAARVPEVSGRYLDPNALDCAFCTGRYGFLVRIAHYNGKLNDAHVRVDYIPSPGLEAPLPWSCKDTSWKQRPCASADLPWALQEDALESRGASPTGKLHVDDAYVARGYLVSRLPGGTVFQFPRRTGSDVATPFPLKLDDGIFAGKLARERDGSWALTDGMLAGRASAEGIFRGFRITGLCEGNPNYKLVQAFVNNNVDVRADGVVDPQRPCDAISVGVGFTAAQARVGRVEPVVAPVECQPAP
ncbi:MAG: hypothetical protein U0174_17825 [Polyangiaceae bacterium]